MAGAARVAALFPPQNRDWALPSEANLSPYAAERVSREAAQKAFDEGVRSLNIDWRTNWDGKQIQRWSEALGRGMVAGRDRQTQAYREGHYPEGPANPPQLLIIGMDGGRWQGREKDAETGNRWREDKVLTVTSYVPGNGQEGEGARKPAPLVRTHLATSRDAAAFGTMARVEAERRGYRQAETVIAMGDGGNWIDPLLEREFRVQARVIDWYHAIEHLWDCARAIHGPQTPATSSLAEQWEAWLWDGQVARVIEALSEHSARLGEPLSTDPPQHPRRVLHQNVGYFTRHRPHMDYPRFRRSGWPIGSGETEASVKQFNKRVKGTEQFWTEAGIEPILSLRAAWVSQDDRWQRYWNNRPAYVN
jgi:hypothetical protein